ncbi:MAG: lipid-A-disaccharide synthase N-terminal domain-containing protein [Gammaproteobacteria bacterium]
MAFQLDAEHFWLGVGFLGQALFSARFIVQWIASEREKRSVIPHLFWWFSLGGGLTLFVYALYRGDQVFILGQGAGLVVYVRNLYFVIREARVAKA